VEKQCEEGKPECKKGVGHERSGQDRCAGHLGREADEVPRDPRREGLDLCDAIEATNVSSCGVMMTPR
jgi:hypothetical protein